MRYAGAKNSTYGAVKQFLEDRDIEYDGKVGGDCHFRFTLRINGDIKVIPASLHRGCPHSVTHAISKIRSFYRKHGVELRR
jgi:hypothetical protein